MLQYQNINTVCHAEFFWHLSIIKDLNQFQVDGHPIPASLQNVGLIIFFHPIKPGDPQGKNMRELGKQHN